MSRLIFALPTGSPDATRGMMRLGPNGTAHRLLRALAAKAPGDALPLSRTTSAEVQILAELHRAGMVQNGELTTIGRATLSVLDGGATMRADLGPIRPGESS